MIAAANRDKHLRPQPDLTPMTIRPERPADVAAIREILASAFPSPLEAELVDRLRAAGRLTVSLVAEQAGRLVGHVAFSPVTIAGEATDVLGLGPLAVLPDHQRGGIGSQLTRAGLDECRSFGVGAVVVLGDPAYYSRFGFVPASGFGLSNEYNVDDPFRVCRLRDDGLTGRAGLVQYAPEFAIFAPE